MIKSPRIKHKFITTKQVWQFIVVVIMINLLPFVAAANDDLPDQIEVEIQEGLEPGLVAQLEDRMQVLLKGINTYQLTGDFDWPEEISGHPGVAAIENEISGTSLYVARDTIATFIRETPDDEYEIGGAILADPNAEEEALKELVVSFNAEGDVTEINFTSGYHNIAPFIAYDNPATDSETDQVIEQLDLYRNSYNHQDTLGIKQMLDPEATVIAASRLPGDRTLYRRHYVAGYTNLLQGLFDHAREAELRFQDPEVLAHPVYEDIYGVRTRQLWYTSEGEMLFMIIDMSDPDDAKIHYRVWRTVDDAFDPENYPEMPATPEAEEITSLMDIGLVDAIHYLDGDQASLAHRYEQNEGIARINVANYSESDLTSENIKQLVERGKLSFNGISVQSENLEIRGGEVYFPFRAEESEMEKQHVEAVAKFSDKDGDREKSLRLYLQRLNLLKLQIADESDKFADYPEVEIYGSKAMTTGLDSVHVQFFTTAGQLIKETTQHENSASYQLAEGRYGLKVHYGDHTITDDDFFIESSSELERDLDSEPGAAEFVADHRPTRIWIFAATGAALIATGVTLIFSGDDDDPPAIPGPPGRP